MIIALRTRGNFSTSRNTQSRTEIFDGMDRSRTYVLPANLSTVYQTEGIPFLASTIGPCSYSHLFLSVPVARTL